MLFDIRTEKLAFLKLWQVKKESVPLETKIEIRLVDEGQLKKR